MHFIFPCSLTYQKLLLILLWNLLPSISTEYKISEPAICSGSSVHSHSRVKVAGVVPLITKRGLGRGCSDLSWVLSLWLASRSATDNESTISNQWLKRARLSAKEISHDNLFLFNSFSTFSQKNMPCLLNRRCYGARVRVGKWPRIWILLGHEIKCIRLRS